MLKNGIISLDMTIPAALAKIEIALRKFPEDPQAQAKFMQSNYVGEVPSEETRFVAMH